MPQFSSSSGSGESESTPLAAGGNPFYSMLFGGLGENMILNTKTGQYQLGSDEGVKAYYATDKQIDKAWKEHYKDWSNSKVRGTSDGKYKKDRANFKKKWEANYNKKIDAQYQSPNQDTLGAKLGRQFWEGINDENPFGQDMLDTGRAAVDAQRNIFDLSTKSLAGLIEDGRPVDIQGLVEQGYADVKEQFGGQGLSYGSDVRNAGLQMQTQMGAQAQENALNRQMGAIGMGQVHGQQGLQFGSQLGNLGSQYELQSTPWGRTRTAMAQASNQGLTGAHSIGSVQSTSYQNKSQSGGGSFGFGLIG